MDNTESRLFGLVVIVAAVVTFGFYFKIEFIINAFLNLLFIAIALGIAVAICFYARALLEDFVNEGVGPIATKYEALSTRLYRIEDKYPKQSMKQGERISHLEQEIKEIKDELEKMKSPVEHVKEEVLQNFL